MEDYTYTSKYVTSQNPSKITEKKKTKKKHFCILINKPPSTKKTGEEITAKNFWELESQYIHIKKLRRIKKAKS